jgi:hypothetical protein
MRLSELNFQISMPNAANMRGLTRIGSYPDTVAPVVVPTMNRVQAVLTRPVNGTNGDILQLPLNDGPDSPQILAYLRQLTDYFGRVPEVRQQAIAILQADSVGNNNLAMQISSLFDFVANHMIYVRDPSGGEFVISPLWVINEWRAGRRVYGDCDDHVLMLNALLQSIGFDTRLNGVKLNETIYYDHVIGQVFVDNTWRDLDPCNKGGAPTTFTDRLVA